MSKVSTRKVDRDLDIPVLKRDQLGSGVRGKYLRQYTQASNVVVLTPEIHKAFPTSEAVNQALASLLAISRETVGFARRGIPRGKARPKTNT